MSDTLVQCDKYNCDYNNRELDESGGFCLKNSIQLTNGCCLDSTAQSATKICYTATISSKGQVTLPKHVREFLEIKSGEKISWSVNNNTITINKEPDKLARKE